MRHSLARISVPGYHITDNNKVYNALLASCHKERLSVLQSTKHEFYPQGLTAVVLLAESHVAIHTYPELGLIYFDAFTCGDIGPELVARAFALAMDGELLGLTTLAR